MACLFEKIVAIIWQVSGLQVEWILSIPYNDQDLLIIYNLYFHLINPTIGPIISCSKLDLAVNFEITLQIALVSNHFKY